MDDDILEKVSQHDEVFGLELMVELGMDIQEDEAERPRTADKGGDAAMHPHVRARFHRGDGVFYNFTKAMDITH